jgi:hypothetical protein
LGADAVIDLLEVCLETTYCQVYDRFYQKEGMVMGSSLSPLVSIIFIDHFEKLALDTAEQNNSLGLRHNEIHL